MGCFHAAGQWLEAISNIPNIALQLQESCCRHMGHPHAICTMCRPEGLEDAVGMRCRRPICDTHQPVAVHDHVHKCVMHY